MPKLTGYDHFVLIEGGSFRGEWIWIHHSIDPFPEISGRQVFTELMFMCVDEAILDAVNNKQYRIISQPTYMERETCLKD